MKHYKYSSIGQYRNWVKQAIEEAQYVGQDENNEPVFDKTIDLPKVPIYGAVKLHGTNAQIVYENGELYSLSRSRVLSVGNDNAGFAAFVDKNHDFILEHYGNTDFILSGEWAGKGIQSKVAISELEKDFYVFDMKVKVGDEWVKLNTVQLHCLIGFKTVYKPTTYLLEVDLNHPQDIIPELVRLTDEVEKRCPIAAALGVDGIGEGIVWSDFERKTKFKVKGEKHAGKSKVKTLPTVDPVKLQSIKDFVDYVLTTSRLQQGLEHVEELDIKHTGTYVKWVSSDVLKEESDTLLASGLGMKDVGRLLSDTARKFYFKEIR